MTGEDALKLLCPFGWNNGVLKYYEPQVQSSLVSQVLHPSRTYALRRPITGRIKPQRYEAESALTIC